MICYKEEDILLNGWCNTNGFNTGGLRGWGICSESCKFLKHKVDREQTSEDFNKVFTYFSPINFFQCCFYFNIFFFIASYNILS